MNILHHSSHISPHTARGLEIFTALPAPGALVNKFAWDSRNVWCNLFLIYQISAMGTNRDSWSFRHLVWWEVCQTPDFLYLMSFISSGMMVVSALSHFFFTFDLDSSAVFQWILLKRGCNFTDILLFQLHKSSFHHVSFCLCDSVIGNRMWVQFSVNKITNLTYMILIGFTLQLILVILLTRCSSCMWALILSSYNKPGPCFYQFQAVFFTRVPT